MTIDIPTTRASVGTNNVRAVDNSVNIQKTTTTTYNHVPGTTTTTYSRRSAFSIGAKSRLGSIKSYVDEATEEFLFMAGKGISEKDYNELADLLDAASQNFYELDAETSGFLDSLMKSRKSKRFEDQARHVHRKVMRTSDALKRGIGKQNNQQAHRAFEEVQPVVDQTQPAPPQCAPFPYLVEQSTPSPETPRAPSPPPVVNVYVNNIQVNIYKMQ